MDPASTPDIAERNLVILLAWNLDFSHDPLPRIVHVPRLVAQQEVVVVRLPAGRNSHHGIMGLRAIESRPVPPRLGIIIVVRFFGDPNAAMLLNLTGAVRAGVQLDMSEDLSLVEMHPRPAKDEEDVLVEMGEGEAERETRDAIHTLETCELEAELDVRITGLGHDLVRIGGILCRGWQRERRGLWWLIGRPWSLRGNRVPFVRLRSC